MPGTLPSIPAPPSDQTSLLSWAAVVTTYLRNLRNERGKVKDEFLEASDKKERRSGYSSLDASGLIPEAQIPVLPATHMSNVGWLLNKDGSNQLNLGTAAELVTWVDSHAASYTNGVTFTDADDSITINTAGVYAISLATRWASSVVDQDLVFVQTKADGVVIKSVVQHPSGGAAQTLCAHTFFYTFAADEVLTIVAADASRTSADIDGAATSTWWMGQRVG